MKNTGQITKVRNEVPFAQIPNDMLRDKRLSMKAKGLLSFLLSLPTDWVVYKTSLPDYFNDGYTAISNAWEELENTGYIVSVRMINSKGQFEGWNHIVYYHSQILLDEDNENAKANIGKTDLRKPEIGEPPTTKKDYTKKDNTKKEYSYVDFIASFNELTKKGCRGDKKSRGQFNARIKDGYTQGDIQSAIEAAVKDKYHIETGYQYLTPEFITRPDKLERFRTMAQGNVPKGRVEITKHPSPEAIAEYERIKAIGFNNCTQEEIEWVYDFQYRDLDHFSNLTYGDDRLAKRGYRLTMVEAMKL